MKKLYFVRHGLSVMNKQGLFSSKSDTPLTDEGKEQCCHAGQQLKDAGITCIVASPSKRTMETAQIIAQEIGFPTDKILINELLLERDLGPLEGTTYSPNADLDGTAGVEHSSDLISRTRQSLNYLENLNTNVILVVSHGAVGRAMYHILNPDTPYHHSKKFHNGEPVELL